MNNCELAPLVRPHVALRDQTFPRWLGYALLAFADALPWIALARGGAL